ncbi:MAG: hypothetical protein ABIG89_06425 [Candidatus Woesearchaeota archaeon]
MNIRKFIRKSLYLAVLSILTFLLISCGNNIHDVNNTNFDSSSGNNLNNGNYVNPDFPDISVPTKMTVYEVNSYPNGVPMQEYAIEEELYDKFKAWEEKKKLKEEWNEYNWKKDAWDKEKKEQDEGTYWNEEARIKAYCRENGYLKCIKITETELKDGSNIVHEVKITCKDSNFDPSKLEWDEYDPDKECKKYDVEVI